MPLGIGQHSYSLHWNAVRTGRTPFRFREAIEFLVYCHQLGAGGVQVSLPPEGLEYASKFGARARELGMFFEAQSSLPGSENDLARFDQAVRMAKTAGAEVLRSALLGTRRYETFDTAEAFEAFARSSWHSLTLAEPVARKHDIRLAIENHKDWLARQLVDILKRLGSECVGACVDTGNNIALLEDPMEVVDALAPYAFSVHLKDMAVQNHEDGFLLSEVPLGEGFLDLKKMVRRLRQANPRIQFCLEMMTRDSLLVPCLTEKYWATMDSVPASCLAATLRLARQGAFKGALPRINGLSHDDQLALEDQNVRKCLAYARAELGI